MLNPFNSRRLAVAGAALIATAATAAPVAATGSDVSRIARAIHPRVSVSPAAVGPGDALTVTGRDWPAGRAVRLHLGRPLGEDVALESIGLVKANSRGRFRKTFWVAADTASGSYTIEACRRECEVIARARFTVRGPVPPPAPTPLSPTPPGS